MAEELGKRGRPVTRELMQSVVEERGIPEDWTERAWYDSMLDNAGIPARFLQNVQNILEEYKNPGDQGWRDLQPGEPNAQAALAQVVGTDMARHIIQNVNAYAEANVFRPYGTGGELSESSGLFFSNSANSSRLRQEDWYGELLTDLPGLARNIRGYMGGEGDVVGGTPATSGQTYDVGATGTTAAGATGTTAAGATGVASDQTLGQSGDPAIDPFWIQSGTESGRRGIFGRYMEANYPQITPLARSAIAARFDPLQAQWILAEAMNEFGRGALGEESPEASGTRQNFRTFLKGLTSGDQFATQGDWQQRFADIADWYKPGMDVRNLPESQEEGMEILRDPTYARNIIEAQAMAGLSPLQAQVSPTIQRRRISRILEPDPTQDIFRKFAEQGFTTRGW